MNDNTAGYALAAFVILGIAGFVAGKATGSADAATWRSRAEAEERAVRERAQRTCGRAPRARPVPDRSERIAAAGRQMQRA